MYAPNQNATQTPSQLNDTTHFIAEAFAKIRFELAHSLDATYALC